MTTETGLPPLAQAYLDRLTAEARRLPPDQAQDLVADIGEHLAAGLGAEPTEADVRNLLDRLGTPAEVVAAAGPTPPPDRPAVPATKTAIGGVEVGAVVALVAAEVMAFLIPVAAAVWVVGLVLLAVSGVWTGREKLRGFLALGTGFPLALVMLIGTVVTARTTSCTATSNGNQTCTSSGAPPWLGLVLLALALGYVAYQVMTARALLKSRA